MTYPRHQKEIPDTYSFCEPATATSHSRWHIRKLTAAGQKLGGGVDTKALCGHVQPPYGWDLDVTITEHHLAHACPECVAAYRKLDKAGSS